MTQTPHSTFNPTQNLVALDGSTKLEFFDLLSQCRVNKASDLIITESQIPYLRIHGQWRPANSTWKPTALQLNGLIDYMVNGNEGTRDATTNERMARLETVRSLDFTFFSAKENSGRFRVNASFSKGKKWLVLRAIPAEAQTLESLEVNPVLYQWADAKRGLVLVTGPTGSGKSTTLTSMVDYINTRSARHIITIEDPIEFYHKDKKSLIHQREIGPDTPNFPQAIHDALRQAPDIILVGEMRDPDTIRTAITAAETGHLVLSTLHAQGAPDTIARIIDSVPAAQQQQVRLQLANNLVGVIWQQLLPRVDKEGRVVAYELMKPSIATRNMVEDPNENAQGFRAKLQTLPESFESMDSHLLQLFSEGKIAAAEAVKHSTDAAEMRNQLAKRGERF